MAGATHEAAGHGDDRIAHTGLVTVLDFASFDPTVGTMQVRQDGLQ